MKKLLLTLLAIVACGLSAFASVKGDVNGDGSVTASDVTALYNYLLYGDTSAIVNGDVNTDGEITTSDVTFVYNILLGYYHPTEHEWVDLGLPSGTLWATMNVGANSPEDYGDKFAWGETTPKDVYNWSTYQWCKGNQKALTKYCYDSSYGNNGFTDNKLELDPEDDAATVNWGPEWRIPSMEQIDELCTNCFSYWTTQNGVNGRLFTGPNGASLFFSAAGNRNGSNLNYLGLSGYYWRRTLSYPTQNASGFNFDSDNVGYNNYIRFLGFSVRAVRVQ